ncbi:MAG: type II toxin-antitoxin system CcdA family antitoxin [Gallionella sp.]
MPTPQTHSLRKRPVNLTLNEELVAEVKSLTPNLSAVVELLLQDYVIQKRRDQINKQTQAVLVAGMWNDFNQQSGSFADEYSTL